MLTNIGFAGVIFTTTSILTWLPTYFHRIDGIPMSQAGMKTGLIMMLAIIGGPVGGWIADVWFKKKASARLLFPAISTILTAVVLFAAFTLLDGKAQYAALLVMGVLIVAFAPAAITVTQDVIHPGLRAISYAVCVIFQNALGAFTAPMVLGALSDSYGIKAAISVLPIFLVISAVLFFLGSFFYEKDLAKVEKVELEMEG
jgi:sugar phosphate permease